MTDARCGQCRRVTETHAEGCSHPDCPHRTPQNWGAPYGAQGFPGQLAEDRILHRMTERSRAVEVGIADL